MISEDADVYGLAESLRLDRCFQCLDSAAEQLVAPSMGPFTLGWERFLVVRQSAKFKPKLGGFEALAAFAVLPL